MVVTEEEARIVRFALSKVVFDEVRSNNESMSVAFAPTRLFMGMKCSTVILYVLFGMIVSCDEL